MSRVLTVLFALASLTPTTAEASTITVFTDRAAWDSLVGPSITETFATATEPTTSTQLMGGLVDGLAIRHSTIVWNGTGDGTYRDAVDWGIAFGGPEDSSTFMFSTPVVAWGADFLQAGVNLSVILRDLDIIVPLVSAGDGYTGFLGFISDVAISRFSFISNSPSSVTGFRMDNAEFATTTVPEPSTLILLGFAGIAAVAVRKLVV